MTVVIHTSRGEEERRTRLETIARRARLMRRARGCCVWFVAIAVVAGVGIWIFVTAFLFADQRAGDQALAEARAAGVPLTLPDLAALQPTSPEIAEATRFWRKATEKLDPTILNERDTASIALIGEGRGDDGVDPPDRDERGRLQGEDLVRASAFLAPFAEAFEAARSARDAGSVANFATSEEGQPMHSGGFVSLYFLGMALRLHAETELAHENVEGAVGDLTTLVAVSDSSQHAPSEWQQSLRHQTVEAAVDLLERMLAVANLNDDRLKRLAESFQDRDERGSFRLGIAASRIEFVDFIEHAEEGFTRNFNIEYASWTRGADLAEGLDLHRQMDEANEQGLIAANERWLAIETELAALAAQPSARTRYPATLIFVPQIGLQLKRRLDDAASVTLARTAIACERYRLATGKLPAKLEDLAPEFLPEAPVDPCDGKPLRYVNGASGVQLYSVGSDGVDDGGGAAAGSGAAMFTPSDIVFRLKKTMPSSEASAAP